MSSLARRSLRTTAAVAGIAAIGAGLAGTAFADPDAPAVPDADGVVAPAAPGPSSVENLMRGAFPSPGDEMAELPQLFTFEAPAINSVGPDVPEVPDASSEPETMETGDMGDMGETMETMEPGENTEPSETGETMEPSETGEAGAMGMVPSTDPLDGIVNTDIDQVNGPDAGAESFTGQNSVGALPSMDTAAMIADLAARAMAGEPVTEGNSVG